MFSVYCPRHGHNVLLGADRVRSCTNLASGVIVLELACTDGELLRLVTGRSASAPTRELV